MEVTEEVNGRSITKISVRCGNSDCPARYIDYWVEVPVTTESHYCGNVDEEENPQQGVTFN